MNAPRSPAGEDLRSVFVTGASGHIGGAPSFPERRLDLRAEMRLPGEALLRFELEPVPGAEPRTRLVQTARFKPRGLLGLGYWYAALPLHGFVFRRMVQGIRRAAQSPAPRTAPGLAAAGS